MTFNSQQYTAKELLDKQNDIRSATEQDFLSAAEFLPGAGIPGSVNDAYDAGIESASYMHSGQPVDAALKGIESIGLYSLAGMEAIPGIGAMINPIRKGLSRGYDMINKGDIIGYHGTGNADDPTEAAKSIQKEGFTIGSSSELDLLGTSISRDPTVSSGMFSDDSMTDVLIVRAEENIPLYHMRPSDYLLGKHPDQEKAAYRKPNAFFEEDEIFLPKDTGAQKAVSASQIPKSHLKSIKKDEMIAGWIDNNSAILDGMVNSPELFEVSSKRRMKNQQGTFNDIVKKVGTLKGRGIKYRALRRLSENIVDWNKITVGKQNRDPNIKNIYSKLEPSASAFKEAIEALTNETNISKSMVGQLGSFADYKSKLIGLKRKERDLYSINEKIKKQELYVKNMDRTIENIDSFPKENHGSILTNHKNSLYTLYKLKAHRGESLSSQEKIKKDLDFYTPEKLEVIKKSVDDLYRDTMKSKDDFQRDMNEYIGRSRKMNLSALDFLPGSFA